MNTIVVIDDNQPTQAFLRDFCGARGENVISWPQGTGAFELIEREQPALVFLDIWLETRTTGWDILQQLKASPSTKDIPVVVASAWHDELREHRPEIERLAAAVLVKPFSIEDIERCLSFVLTRAT